MDKIQIFKGLTVRDLREEGYDKFSAILGDYYGQFSSFCNFVQDQCKESPELEEHIEGMECSINDNGAEFTVNLSNGEAKTIHFVDSSEIIHKGEGKILYQKKSRPLSIQEMERREEERERELREAEIAASTRKRSKTKKK